MKLLLPIVLLANFASLNAQDQHRTIEKSLREVNLECRQYLRNDPSCLSRCETLLTRDWNDCNGLNMVFGRYYRPDADDYDYQNRTKRCLNRVYFRTGQDATCSRVDDSVGCFKDQYGTVLLDQQRYVKHSDLQQTQILFACANMLQVPLDLLTKSSEVNLRDLYQNPATRCLPRCFIIRSGLYSDSEGLNMARFYVQCGGYDEAFSRNATQCVQRILQSGQCDKCALAYDMVDQCIGGQYDINVKINKLNASGDNAVVTAGRDMYDPKITISGNTNKNPIHASK